MREITVILPKAAAKQFEGRVFRNYKQVAQSLKPKQEVVVMVRDAGQPTKRDPDPLNILLGYGYVTGIDSNGQYTVPRRLLHEV